MTLQELKDTKPLFVTADDLKEILEVNPANLRSQTQSDPQKLGFPVIVIGTRVKIPVKPFLRFLGEE